jgi:hypothetical protein
VGYVGCREDMRNAYKIPVGESVVKRPRGGPRHTWRIILNRILGK